MPQWARFHANNSAAEASIRNRLVIPYTTSTVVSPFEVRSRTTRNT
ncbi:hypothetical protein [Fimbriiglobus ruber]|nr:hypothetical protein [Fimbriiglobus ruber]